MLDGLTREVREETGLVVTEWEGPIYEIEVRAPDLGWRLRVESFRALAYDGRAGGRRPRRDRRRRPVRGHRPLRGPPRAARYQWVAEPLSEWLVEPWTGLRSFGYDVAGGDLASLSVTRR